MLAGHSKSQKTKEKSTELWNGQHIIIITFMMMMMMMMMIIIIIINIAF